MFDLNAFNQAFEFFDDFRENSGQNVYAAPRELADEWDEPKENARKLFKAWTDTFSDAPVADRAQAAFNAQEGN